MGGAGWGREHFQAWVYFWGLGLVAAPKEPRRRRRRRAAVVELGKVARRPLEVARAGGLRRAAAAVVGAVLSAVLSRVRGAPGGLGRGAGKTKVGQSQGVGDHGQSKTYWLRKAAIRWGEKRPCERVGSGEWRVRNQRLQPTRRRRPKGRAPARELQAGWAPSGPQGAGCRDFGLRRGWRNLLPF